MTEQLADLVALARSGDTAAYATLYEQHAPAVCRFLRSRLNGSQEEAEDITSTVFLKVWQKMDLYVDRGLPFESWVFQIARNCLIDHLRRQPGKVVDSLDLAFAVPDAGTGSAFGQMLDRQVLEDALALLGAEQRQTVTLRFLDGLSLMETAREMGRSTDAVKKLQARALVNMRRLLSPVRSGIARRRLILAA